MIWYFIIFTLVVGTIMSASGISNPFLAYPSAFILSFLALVVIALAVFIVTLLVGLLALFFGIVVSL